MLTKYVEAAMKKAKYKPIEDGTYFGTIPGLKGLWANAVSLEECEVELRETLEDWLIVKLRHDDALPRMGGISLGRPLTKSA